MAVDLIWTSTSAAVIPTRVNRFGNRTTHGLSNQFNYERVRLRLSARAAFGICGLRPTNTLEHKGLQHSFLPNRQIIVRSGTTAWFLVDSPIGR